MSENEQSVLLEPKNSRKKLLRGIRASMKRVGPDAKEVRMALIVLRHIDELIAEQEVRATLPNVASF